MRKNETRKKKVLIVLMIIILILNILFGIENKVQAYEVGDFITIYTGGSMTCLYDEKAGDYASIEYLNYLGEDAYYPAYHITDDGNPIYQDRVSIYQGLNANEEIQKIIYAGYPYHSYSDLGCTDAYQAYVATQLVILEYTQGENLSNYTATNERGEETLQAIQRIKQNLATQPNLKPRPEIYFSSQSDWEIYENDESYMVKTVQVDCTVSEYMNSIDIFVTNGTGIYFIDETGIEKNSYFPSERFRILLPVNLMENEEEILIKAFMPCETNQQFVAQATTTGESFLLTKNPTETIVASYQEQLIQTEEEQENPDNPEDTNQEDSGDITDEEENDKTSNEIVNENQNNNENTNQNESQNQNQNQNQSEIKNNNEQNIVNENINENQVKVEQNTVFEPKWEIYFEPKIQIEILEKNQEAQVKKEEIAEKLEEAEENEENQNSEKEIQMAQEKTKETKSIEISTQNSMLKTTNQLKSTQNKLPRTGY